MDEKSPVIFIGPESDHWQPIRVTLAVEDANSKLVKAATVADEKCIGNIFFAYLEAVWS